MDYYLIDFISISSIIVMLFYVMVTIVLHIGLRKSIKTTSNKTKVSIIIAARDEEKYLVECLNSIEKQNYPKDKIEVLIVNDRSIDKTKQIAESFCNRISYFKLLNISKSKAGLYGKMNALAQGIDSTTGEIVLITDADCEVPGNWVSEFVKYFQEKVGMCGSLTLLSKYNKGENFFTRLQALDWVYLQAVASGSSNMGLPVSILGNNFAFRRQAYEDVGGFQKLGFSLTEDMALLQAIHKLKKWKIVYPLNLDTIIFSKPMNTIKDFYIQRKRWVLGGKTTHLWGYFIISVSLFSLFILIASLIMGLWNITFIILIIMIISDSSLILLILNRIKRFDLTRMLFAFKFFYAVYAIIFSIVLILSKQVSWKNTVHRIK